MGWAGGPAAKECAEHHEDELRYVELLKGEPGTLPVFLLTEDIDALPRASWLSILPKLWTQSERRDSASIYKGGGQLKHTWCQPRDYT